MDFLVSSAASATRGIALLLLFPFTHVCFPIVLFIFALVKHLLLIPILLIFRTAVYGLIYIPLLPVLHAVSVDHDTLVPVEVSLFRLGIAFLPHIQIFVSHFVHYFMVSLFVGSFVGIVAGFNIRVVSKVLEIPAEKSDFAMKRLSETAARASDWKRMKRETPAASAADAVVKIEGNDAKSVAEDSPEKPTDQPTDQPMDKSLVLANDKTEKPSPIVKIEKTPFSLPRVPELAQFPNAIFEDDDGYNYMTYKISDQRRRQAKSDSYTKRKENRYRSAPSSLHTTIEEESESEVTPTPIHTSTTNHVTLDFATGTIGSAKTFSTDSSVFSKTLEASRTENDDTLQESAGNETEVSDDVRAMSRDAEDVHDGKEGGSRPGASATGEGEK